MFSGEIAPRNYHYHGDTSIGGSPESVLSDAQRCFTEFERIGHEVKPRKTEIIYVGLAVGNFYRVVDSFYILLQELKVTELTKM